MSRPELGSIAKGDQVWVYEGHGRGGAPVPSVVVGAGPVWIRMQDAYSGRREWKMRRDKQDDGSGYATRARFVTPAQKQYDDRMQAARLALEEQGVTLKHDSPWRDDELLVTLATWLDLHDPRP